MGTQLVQRDLRALTPHAFARTLAAQYQLDEIELPIFLSALLWFRSHGYVAQSEPVVLEELITSARLHAIDYRQHKSLPFFMR